MHTAGSARRPPTDLDGLEVKISICDKKVTNFYHAHILDRTYSSFLPVSILFIDKFHKRLLITHPDTKLTEFLDNPL